jgi:hypothetical protein
VLEPGAPFVLDALDFDERMRAARAVVTGEGKLDEQTLQGKLVGEIGTRARQAGVPLHAIVGRDALDAFGKRIIDLQGRARGDGRWRRSRRPARRSAPRSPRAAREPRPSCSISTASCSTARGRSSAASTTRS